MEATGTRFEFRAPQNLHDAWDLIYEGLERCNQHDKDARLEDVYHCLRSGASILLVGYYEDEYCGFAIINPRAGEFSGKPYWHVWCAYNTKGHDVMRTGYAQIAEMARARGAQKVSFSATRTSFGRLFKDIGFELEEVTYAKQL